MTIKILVTGGTFDKEYMELTGELLFKNTHVHEMLDLARCKIDVKIRTLLMMDSVDITDYHRDIIYNKCKDSSEEKIVITHGTDTMSETAKFLGRKIKNKTIVLTGALIPYAFGSSDGLFNLGSALAFVQSLPSGVYVVMNGRCFDYDNVRKNKTSGVFEVIK